MADLQPVEFLATLSGSSAVRFDAEGGGKVIFEIDDSHTAALVRLLTMRRKIIKVTCQEHFKGA